MNKELFEKYPNATVDEIQLIDNFVNPRLPEGAMKISQSFFDIAEYLLTETPQSVHRLMAIQEIHRGKDSAVKAWFLNIGY